VYLTVIEYKIVSIKMKRHDTRMLHAVEGGEWLLILVRMLCTSHTSLSSVIHAGHFKFESYAVVMGPLAIMVVRPFRFMTYANVW
jgi:hypothetical protein